MKLKHPNQRLKNCRQKRSNCFGIKRCYGHMYCQQEQLSEITLQLTYYQTTTKQITRQERHFTEAALAEFY